MAPTACILWFPRYKYIFNLILGDLFGVIKGRFLSCARHKPISVTVLSSKAQPLESITSFLIIETFSIDNLESHH